MGISDKKFIESISPYEDEDISEINYTICQLEHLYFDIRKLYDHESVLNNNNTNNV